MSSLSEKTTNAKNSAKRFFRKLAIILLVIGIGLMFFFYYATYSTGVRAGVVLKISDKGAIFKTYEGQLDLMSFGAVKDRNNLSQTFSFSVEKNNEEVFKTLEDVSLTGERVRLRYVEKYVVLPWRGDTKLFVTDVERAPDPKTPNRTGDFE